MGADLPLVRSILALPGLSLRRDWLRAQIRERPLGEVAPQLNALCESAEALVEASREALVAWVAVLIGDVLISLLDEMRRVAHERRCHSLERILRTYPVASAPELDAAEPPYNPELGRELTVGERRSLARMPQRGQFERLLRDPHPLVLRQLLGNPKLTENDVLKLAAMRPARATTIQTLAEFPDWMVRTRIRMAVISNPLTPSHIAVPLTTLATRPELSEIAENPSLHVVLRVLAQELLDKHPPLGPVDTETLQ